MLGLGGIGALAMAQGVSTHTASLDDRGTRRAPAHPAAAQASLAGGAPLEGPPAALPTPAASDAPGATSPVTSGVTSDGRVILNLASADELRKLPGVGQKRAEAIVALRQKLGKFKRPTDLLRIRGIGTKRLKQMLPKLVVDPPKESVGAVPSSGPPASGAPAPSASAVPN
jgi:competence protein ComEA